MSNRRHGNKEAKKAKKVPAQVAPPLTAPALPRAEPARRGSK